MGVEIDWPSQEFQNLATLCDGLDEGGLEQIKRSAFALASNWWQEEAIQKAQPSDRAKALLRSKVPFSEQKGAPEMLRKALDDTRGTTSIPISAINEIAVFLQVSPHWLLRFAPDVSLLGMCATTDVILDAFSFMPRESKQIFMAYLLHVIRGVNDLFKPAAKCLYEACPRRKKQCGGKRKWQHRRQPCLRSDLERTESGDRALFRVS